MQFPNDTSSLFVTLTPAGPAVNQRATGSGDNMAIRLALVMLKLLETAMYERRGGRVRHGGETKKRGQYSQLADIPPTSFNALARAV